MSGFEFRETMAGSYHLLPFDFIARIHFPQEYLEKQEDQEQRQREQKRPSYKSLHLLRSENK